MKLQDQKDKTKPQIHAANAINQIEDELVKPNYLSTFDYIVKEKK